MKYIKNLLLVRRTPRDGVTKTRRVFHLASLFGLTFFIFHFPFSITAATTVATKNGIPITDTDITARASLMRLQNQPEEGIRVRALANIIDDLAKLEYASQFRIAPTKQETDDNIRSLEMQMGKGEGFFKREMPRAEDQLALAAGANLAWQKVVMQVFAPQVQISKDEIQRELAGLAISHGLPERITLVTSGNCKTGNRITADAQDLDIEVRRAIADLPLNQWSKETNGTRFMVCDRTRDEKEWQTAEKFAENQAIFKRALFDADQQLKSNRRRAVISLNDETYRRAIE